jgi:uncharacterized membrane protein YidH (DUF202 family)
MKIPTIDDLLESDATIGEVPPIPAVDTTDAERASVEYSQHRTKLSTHRTALSTRRTGFSVRRTELSSRRTGMSFHRTRMSAERTLMSVIRTSLSLISFGFTIYQFLGHLAQQNVLTGDPAAARHFGRALVYLGIVLLLAGIAYHLQFMWGLRQQREQLRSEGAIHAQSHFPVSFTLLVAVLLLLVGIAAGVSLTFRAGPFG